MKRKTRHSLSSAAARIVGIALFAVFTLALVLYEKGVYDFTFVKRTYRPGTFISAGEEEETDERQMTDTEKTDPASDTEPLTDTDTSGEKTPDDGPDEPIEDKISAREFSESLPLSKTVEDPYRLLSFGVYDPSVCKVAKLRVAGTKNVFSVSEYDARTLSVTEYERGCIYTEAVKTPAPRPGLLLSAGYIIRDNGDGTLSLLNSEGTLVIKDYDESTFRLTEMRTADGKPIFSSSKWEKQKVKVPIMEKNEFTGQLQPTGEYEPDEVEKEVEVFTYYTISGDGENWDKISDTALTEAEADRGLLFDSPLDYGESDCDLERYLSGSRWGYRLKSNGRVVVYPRFKKAYNPKNGYAVAYDDTRLYFLDEKGTIVNSVGFDMPSTFATFNEITIPDTNGIEALGTFYFSHGLTRVRIRKNLVTYKLYYYIKSDDYSALIDVNGEPFPIPGGYSLVSYSDGILLLKRDGEELYGYMNYKGEWIAQPEYTFARPFLSGLAAVGDSSGKCGMIDTAGSCVIPVSYQYVSDLSQGNVAVYDPSTGWEVYQIFTEE